VEALNIYPARHFVTPEERLEAACSHAIEQELQSRSIRESWKLIEAQRIDQRNDLEMLREVGYATASRTTPATYCAKLGNRQSV